MEDRHRSALDRLYQADRSLQDGGREPETFVLSHGSDIPRPRIDHPGWNPSWVAPTKHTIDDLAELGILRLEANDERSCSFFLTMRGRQEAAAAIPNQPELAPGGALIPHTGTMAARRGGTTIARHQTAGLVTSAESLSSTELSELARAGLEINELADALEVPDPDARRELLAYKLESDRQNALLRVLR